MNKQLKTLISWAKKYMVEDDELKISIEGKEYKISLRHSPITENLDLIVFNATNVTMQHYEFDYLKNKWTQFR